MIVNFVQWKIVSEHLRFCSCLCFYFGKNFLSDHLSRNDLSVDESRGESFLQGMTQWLYYLSLVSITIQNKGVEAPTEMAFESLSRSAVFSIISLSWGQFKVYMLYVLYSFLHTLQAHLLATEYSTTFLQKCVYFGASFGLYESIHYFRYKRA